MDLFLSKSSSTPTGKNNISAEVMPFDSPGVRFITLPRSSEQAGSSFPRLRGELLIYKTLKLVLLQEGEREIALCRSVAALQVREHDTYRHIKFIL